ncbi:Predicted arabinose efflux permease, MFS family [Seinonella peptonophila]|uniref:Predicted arabinose efflux permease, MFS family n=1 Tax=Seinonella peptonophila TaxID=112248 RepID=A0A1M4XM82_9BACL|nr:MFS transporter [Seinonella peptonophila]SHE94579.1 Predicted arabinose efflux permease, MFS family [Seinonella peptonophila]
MDYKARQRGRNITVLATFFAFMGIGVVDPILPAIAEQIGASHWQVETLFSAYMFTMAMMMLPAGLLISRLGDKKVMMVGLIAVTAFAICCSLSAEILQLALFRAGWGMGNAFFFATAMTLLIALSDDTNKAVGLYEAAIGLGMAAGPLLGGVLGENSWRQPFVATGILMFIAALLVFFWVRQPQEKPLEPTAKTTNLSDMGRLFVHKPFITSALAGMLYYYGFFTILAYSPLVLHLSAVQLGFVFFGWGLLLAYGSAILTHKLEKRYAMDQLLKISLGSFFVLLTLLAVINHHALFISLLILSGLICGVNNALFTSYTMKQSPYSRGVTSGTYNFVRWLGAGIAPILSGFLGQSFTPVLPFVIAAALIAIAWFAIHLSRRFQHKPIVELSS